MSQQPNLPPPSSISGLTPADIWRVIRKRLWLVIACVVVFGLGGTGGLVAWRLYAPYFTAEGVVEVEPGRAPTAALTGGYDEQIPVPLFDFYIKSQVLAIKNDRVLTAALQTLGAEQVMYVGPNASYRLGQDLEVTHIQRTQNIVVSLAGRDKQEVKKIVGEVLTQYIEQLRVDRAQADGDRQRELRLERDDLRKQLDDLGTRLAAFRDESSVIVSDERGGEHLARLTALVQQLTRAQVELAQAGADWTQFQELRKQSEDTKDLSPILMAFPEITEAMRADRSIVGLSDRASSYGQELQSLTQRFGPQHETVKRLQVGAQAASNDLEAKQTEVIGQLFQQQASILKKRYDSARAGEAELQSRVAEARAAAVGAAKLTAEYRARSDEYRRVQELLYTVMDGLERMRISSALARPNVRLVRVPQIPVEPSEPRLALYIPAVMIFSVLLGIGLSLLFELMDTRLRTPAQVVRQIGLPSLANVPDLSEDERLSLDTNVALVSHTAPQSLLAESFRQLRTSLLFASDQPIKGILVTSPNPGDGKSVVGANLAITMARSGARVLLIDANFRRPSLARAFDLPGAVGLSNVLVGLNTAAEAIQATAIENLDVLVCGAPPPSPTELLGSQSMRQLVADQMRAYDRVIIDGAPMLVVADNHLLAEFVDGVVLVFRAGENTRGMAQRAARQLLSLRAHLLGAVLNRVRATKGGYFRESYQAYYDYASDAGAAKAVAPRTARAAKPQARPAPAEDRPDMDDTGTA
ncbi:MAG: polysaccharide biosynthesis tyrosine autokinase [Planctomycetes bacterium]|nr:polysaccharide biosynthesis tyrosine autokinase [Planctomycetota bacterium]